MDCDHIIGQYTTKTQKMIKGELGILETAHLVTASEANWRPDDHIITKWWDGPHYTHCLKCNASLGLMVVGMRRA